MSLVGRHIGRYRILEQLGQGGMSVVYKGLDTTLDREVAVKVLHPHLATKLESRKRLEREAKAVARLHHANILEVFDFAGADSAEAYIVTELIRGKTLRQFITEESLQPPEIAAMVVFEIASALAHAHDQGVIHRDLKPENVMVREDGVLKLMDFGIAKILDRDEKMTMTGALVGSPAHMAPEIIEGEEAGAEADIFSLGTMLYLFATGKLPFTAPNTTATLRRVLDCVYDDPRQVMPTVSDELAEIIDTCLQRDPSARYPTASKLRDALGEVLGEIGITRTHEELPRFFLDPRGYRVEIVGRVTAALLGQAERLLAEKKSARALAALNQVLAHDPSNAKADSLLGAMKARTAREQRTKRVIRAALMMGSVFILAMSGMAGYRVATRAPDYQPPLTFGPAEVVLTGVDWPVAPTEAPTASPRDPADVRRAPAAAITRVTLPPAPANAGLVDVQILVRPWGYVSIDRGPRSPESLAVHQLKVTPGPHDITVTCDACDVAGVTRSEKITAGRDPITFAAPLRPSLVSFDGFPPEALVRVGSQERTVAETKLKPFRIVPPPEGWKEMRHQVRYEVVLAGETLEQGERAVEPGRAVVIERRGAP